MKNLFRGQKTSRRAGSASDFGAVQETGETALVFVNLPFAPDYFQTVISLCEVIRQLYTKIGSLLGPHATTPNLSDVRSAARSPGPSGNSSPRASTFASTMNKNRTVSGMSSQMGSGGTSLHGGAGGSSMSMSIGGRAGWVTGTGEQIMKLDLKLKKILNMFAREMESIARKAVDEELASLLHGESRRSFGIGSSFGTAID
ncbi:hypothetical protein FFLO_04381 [Filobasidium floriforme]|uniref:Uncharacterized protein n=2 Tax=Filobasidium floriforme TaxID=5210 RepID=A0A8K0NPY9_9TREE|nr:hypothetical protein FFLO_04381 [Filobasidium floriforme]